MEGRRQVEEDLSWPWWVARFLPRSQPQECWESPSSPRYPSPCIGAALVDTPTWGVKCLGKLEEGLEGEVFVSQGDSKGQE